ncbi:deoxyhypusine synthase family protein [Limisphaera sp. VF-2]|uniref:deoxyhypusine synthase family protein n=1 Tax=Limisphaera sp. VF-2 TaxID=3400418 RepID=UPI0017780E50
MTSATLGPVGAFVREHFRHFNAAVVVRAGEAYVELLAQGGRMFLAMAGAMSTAELGRSLAEMIRRDKVHAICCTGANLEEDLFNLIGQRDYVQVPEYRHLTPREEEALMRRGLNRVTDVCIPEHVMMQVHDRLLPRWQAAERAGQRKFPHEYVYELLRSGELEPLYQADPRHSWLLAAAQRNLPLFVPGWEDSTLGNLFVARVADGSLQGVQCIRTGLEAMLELTRWYEQTSAHHPIGFFQIGGGIAGDFAVCVVPLLRQDLKRTHVPLWAYFCQISDSTTSYGSYSGAVPNEKITWGKLGPDTPRFVIESDATVIAPLIFARVLGW